MSQELTENIISKLENPQLVNERGIFKFNTDELNNIKVDLMKIHKQLFVPKRNICHCSYGHYTFMLSIQVLLIYYLRHTCLCIFIRSTFMLFNSSVLNLKMPLSLTKEQSLCYTINVF
jgi:hypothetical protein